MRLGADEVWGEFLDGVQVQTLLHVESAASVPATPVFRFDHLLEMVDGGVGDPGSVPVVEGVQNSRRGFGAEVEENPAPLGVGDASLSAGCRLVEERLEIARLHGIPFIWSLRSINKTSRFVNGVFLIFMLPKNVLIQSQPRSDF